MKLFVTGCCGFIGSHFVEMAQAAGHEIIGIDCMSYAGRKNNISHLKPFAFYQRDINDADLVRAILHQHEPDAIVHLAAETHVSRSIESREEFLRSNVMGTNVLLEEFLAYWRGDQDMASETRMDYRDYQAKLNFRFLHVSTDEVYGSLGAGEQAWTEESPYLPNNPYAASKAASDHLVRSYNRTYGLPTIITHAANNYGTKQHPEKLIPTLIGQCMRGEAMTLHGDGHQKRDWLHVEDHCRGLLLALEHGQIGEVYNFGGECERTNSDIALLIGNHFLHRNGQVQAIMHTKDRPGNDRRYLMFIDKAMHALGWEPQHKIEDSIANIVQWHLDNPNYGDEYGK
jgi:dTDP-glucose 4,6-dehydratase